MENNLGVPDIDLILSGERQSVPERNEDIWATMWLLGAKAQPEHLEAVLRYILRLPVEYGVLLVNLLARRKGMIKPLSETPAYREWMTTHSKEIIPLARLSADELARLVAEKEGASGHR